MQEKITFRNREGQQLAGVMHRPASGAAKASALFALVTVRPCIFAIRLFRFSNRALNSSSHVYGML